MADACWAEAIARPRGVRCGRVAGREGEDESGENQGGGVSQACSGGVRLS